MNKRTVEKSLHIWYSAEQMYDLVSDVPQYPLFLPWCSQARILQQHDDGVSAEIEMQLTGLKLRFATRNTQTRPDHIHMRLLNGPFSLLEGDWHFRGVTAAFAQTACEIQFSLRYAFSSSAAQVLMGPVFAKIANNLVDAFIARAEKVYG